MGEHDRETCIFRFGVFEFDTRRGELRKEGRTEPRLRDQAAQVLSMLLHRPQEVVALNFELPGSVFGRQIRLWISITA